MEYSYMKLKGHFVVLDPNSHFYIDSKGNGEGWKSKTIPYDGKYFKVNYIAPGAKCPIHIRGRDNDLGWVKPSMIISVKYEKEEFHY